MGNLSSQDTEGSLLRLSERSVRNCSEVFLKTTAPHRIVSRIISPGWPDGYGDPNNPATEQIYIELNVTRQTASIDPTEASWQEVTVALTGFGINLGNVTTFTIGLERTGATGGSGTLLFDDIRLYLPEPQ